MLITAPGHPLARAGRTLIKDLAEEPFVDFRGHRTGDGRAASGRTLRTRPPYHL